MLDLLLRSRENYPDILLEAKILYMGWDPSHTSGLIHWLPSPGPLSEDTHHWALQTWSRCTRKMRLSGQQDLVGWPVCLHHKYKKLPLSYRGGWGRALCPERAEHSVLVWAMTTLPSPRWHHTGRGKNVTIALGMNVCAMVMLRQELPSAVGGGVSLRCREYRFDTVIKYWSGWRDTSAWKVLSAQTFGLEFSPLSPL